MPTENQTAHRDRPILFNGPMVRAILEGRKTATRRVVQPWQCPKKGEDGQWCAIAQRDPRYGFCVSGATATECAAELAEHGMAPYGRPGDRLWVREAFADLQGTGIDYRPDPASPLSQYAYAADSPPGSHSDEVRKDCGVKWKPSIHMPRWASRILLEVTAVRVERLQDITEEQAIAEGIDLDALADAQDLYDMVLAGSGADGRATPITAFRDLWNSTGGDWDANPWVWVIEFKRVTP